MFGHGFVESARLFGGGGSGWMHGVGHETLVVHASSKSQSQNPRHVLHMEYVASATVGDSLELAVA